MKSDLLLNLSENCPTIFQHKNHISYPSPVHFSNPSSEIACDYRPFCSDGIPVTSKDSTLHLQTKATPKHVARLGRRV